MANAFNGIGALGRGTGGTPLWIQQRNHAYRQSLVGTLCCLMLIIAMATSVAPLPFGAADPDLPGVDGPAEGRDGEVEARTEDSLAADSPVDAAWPEADSVEFDLSQGAVESEVGGLPVRIETMEASESDAITLSLLPADVAVAAGVDGVILAVAGAKGPVSVEIDYSSFAGLYGGNFGARLRAWELSDCAAGSEEDCTVSAGAMTSSNDSETSTVSFVVDPSYTTTQIVALAAADASAGGAFGATPLAPSSSWTQSGASGAFNWSYPIEIPRPSVIWSRPSTSPTHPKTSTVGRLRRTTRGPGSVRGSHMSLDTLNADTGPVKTTVEPRTPPDPQTCAGRGTTPRSF
nr:hypothetical protein GCM10025732_25850 [Glycomyces mayteni]